MALRPPAHHDLIVAPVAPDGGPMATLGARRLAIALGWAVRTRGAASLALSGGTTPRGAYAGLAVEPGVDWRAIRVLFVDERAAAPDDDRSNAHWATMTLLSRVPVAPASIHRMPGERADLDQAAREYDALLRREVEADASGVPCLDVVVLGVGDDGHTASLFPGESTVEVAESWVAVVPARASREARLTLTRPVLQHAAHVFVLAAGSAKRAALERVWAPSGDLRETPARLVLACRGSVTWIVDEAALPS
jgi:6-phosphogluconolactonase